METSSLVFKSASASATDEYSMSMDCSSSAVAVEACSGVAVNARAVAVESDVGAVVGPDTAAAELSQAERTENMKTASNTTLIRIETPYPCFRYYPARIVSAIEETPNGWF